MKAIKMLLALIRGEAVVITKTSGNKADVVIGKGITKQFALSSMAGACKTLML
jgi:hypothetical protein